MANFAEFPNCGDHYEFEQPAKNPIPVNESPPRFRSDRNQFRRFITPLLFCALAMAVGCQSVLNEQASTNSAKRFQLFKSGEETLPGAAGYELLNGSHASQADRKPTTGKRYRPLDDPTPHGTRSLKSRIRNVSHEETADWTDDNDGGVKTIETEVDQEEDEYNIAQAAYFNNSDGTATLSLHDAVGAALELSNSVRLVQLQAEVQTNAVDSAKSKFDPVMNAGLQFADADRQVSSAIEARGLGLNSVQNRLIGGVNGNDLLSVEKTWESGTRAKLGYITNYERSNPAGQFLVVNPAFNTALNFSVEQPLWQGRNSEFNTAPVRLARVNVNRSFHQSQQEINELLFNVEQNYWRAHQAEQDVTLLQSLVDQARETVAFEESRLANGEGNLVAQARAEEYLETLRAELAQSQLKHRQAVNTLARAIGFDAEVAGRIRLSQQPIADIVEPSLERGLKTALQTRPELAGERERLAYSRIQMKQAREYLKPAVNLVAGYSVTGLNDSVFGSLTDVSTGQFGDFSLGVRYQRPFGKRREQAQVREAENAFQQARVSMRRVEDTIEYEVRQSHQKLDFAYEVLERQRSRIAAATRQVAVYGKLQKAGKVSIDQVFDARESLLRAKRSELAALSDYNIALSEWRYSIGQMTSRMQNPHAPNQPPAGTIPENAPNPDVNSEPPELLPVSEI